MSRQFKAGPWLAVALLAGVLALAVGLYLLYALLRAERF